MGSVLSKDGKQEKGNRCKTKTKITATRLCGVKNGKVFRERLSYHYVNNFFKLLHTRIFNKTSQWERKVQELNNDEWVKVESRKGEQEGPTVNKLLQSPSKHLFKEIHSSL